MGVLPLQFQDGVDRQMLKLDGTETYDVTGTPSAGGEITLVINRTDGSSESTSGYRR